MFRFAPTFSQEDLAEDINGQNWKSFQTLFQLATLVLSFNYFIFFVFFTILSLLD